MLVPFLIGMRLLQLKRVEESRRVSKRAPTKLVVSDKRLGLCTPIGKGAGERLGRQRGDW